jgi:hypothetical protein
MKTNALFVFLALAALTLSACVCGPTNDVSFSYTVGGQTCTQLPQVAKVTIEIPNYKGVIQQSYLCATGATGGFRLFNFQPGFFSYTIRALSNADEVLFAGTGSFSVSSGSLSVSQELTPIGTLVSWTFPTGSPVTCQFASTALIKVDNAAGREFQCSDGANSPGILLTGLAPGEHNIDISLRDPVGQYYYRKITTFNVVRGQTTFQQFALDWIVGSLALKWNLSSNGVPQTCAQAGVSQVGIFLKDPAGNILNGPNGLAVPCVNEGAQGFRLNYVYGNNYTVILTAVGPAGMYQSDSEPRSVVNGVFPAVDAPTLTPVLVLKK